MKIKLEYKENNQKEFVVLITEFEGNLTEWNKITSKTYLLKKK